MYFWKNLFLLAKIKTFSAGLLFCCLIFSCSSVKVYIVRHAEKSAEPKDNPHLTAAGQQRAEALSSLLRDKKISAIYSTETNRTLETAAPLSRATGIPVQPYRNDTLKKFLYDVLGSRKNSVIVGHSNSVIGMLDTLKLKHNVKEIPDNDYDNLFIITRKAKRLRLQETIYGKKSPAPGDTAKPVMH